MIAIESTGRLSESSSRPLIFLMLFVIVNLVNMRRRKKAHQGSTAILERRMAKRKMKLSVITPHVQLGRILQKYYPKGMK